MDGGEVADGGEIGRQAVRGEVVQFQKDGDKFLVNGPRIVRMQEEVFLAEHGANLVGLRLADEADAFADDRLRREAVAEAAAHGLMDAGVKEEPPVFEQRRARRQPP